MISECANPDCLASLDYRTGRWFRFHLHHAPDKAPRNTHSVQHFWLCQRCSETYTLIDRGDGVLLSFRLCPSTKEDSLQRIATACEPRERHPVFPSARNLVTWPVSDPEVAAGEPEARKQEFRQVRDQIRSKVEDLIETMNEPDRAFGEAHSAAA